MNTIKLSTLSLFLVLSFTSQAQRIESKDYLIDDVCDNRYFYKVSVYYMKDDSSELRLMNYPKGSKYIGSLSKAADEVLPINPYSGYANKDRYKSEDLELTPEIKAVLEKKSSFRKFLEKR